MTQNFLERILETKRREVLQLKEVLDVAEAKSRGDSRGFAEAIRQSDRLAVVAEIKKASPSKGIIEPNFRPRATAETYQAAGATCISVLTDREYFMGSLDVLRAVKDTVDVPVLRKDFIIDEVQVAEASMAGADAVLLIVAALTDDRLKALSNFAHDLGLDTLVEVHSESELEQALSANATVLGVNNRDLTTFDVRLETSERLIPLVPAGIPTLAESGIKNATDAQRMAACGASGILVGESLMRSGSGDSLADALSALQVGKDTAALRNGRL